MSEKMTLQGKTITVFGGTGFLGRHIIWQLAKTGANIRVATRQRQRAYFLRPAGSVGQVVPWACDVHDDASVNAALSGAAMGVNLIGILKPSGKGTFQSLHVDAAARIAKAARANNLELLVHVSALGASKDGLSEYSRSKAEGENRVIHEFSRSVVLRPSVVFGPEDNFFNMFATLAQRSPVLPLIGGHSKFQPVYVGDVAKAVHNIVAAGDLEKYYGQIFELGGPQAYTVRALLEIMKGYTCQNACLVSIPAPAAKIIGLFTGLMPGRTLTVDQVRMMQSDCVLDPASPGLRDLGVSPSTLESILPTYLSRYRSGGRFSEKSKHLKHLGGIAALPSARRAAQKTPVQSGA